MHCLFNLPINKRAGDMSPSYYHSFYHLLQLDLCLPEQLTCLKTTNRTDKECLDACNGLFADVRIEPNETAASSHFKAIVEEYVRYKEDYVQNIEFNSSLDSKSFGELKIFRMFCFNWSSSFSVAKRKTTHI